MSFSLLLGILYDIQLLYVSDDDLIAPMAVDAMLAVKTTFLRGDIKYPVKAVNILKVHERSARESLFVQGYALNCTVASQGMTCHLPKHMLSDSPPTWLAMKKRI